MRGRRRLVRLAGVLFLDGFRAAPGWMTLVTTTLVLGSVASTSYPIGYRLLVDGALGGSRAGVVAGVLVIGLLVALGWLLYALGASHSMAVSDRIALHRTAALVALIGGVRTLEHLERPDYLAQVERLNAGRRQLAAAPRTMLSNASSVARIAALLVLLATVSPWLLLLPLSAVAPMVADRIARRITTKADDAMADTRRRSDAVFALTTEAAGASEIRSYGLAEHLTALHRRLGGELGRRSGTEAVAVLAVQSVGWLVYAAMLMGAVAFVVLRATDGALSVGTVLMAVSLIRRSRAQLAGAAATSGALVSALSTADRLLWLEEHAAAERARAGTAPPPARMSTGVHLRGVTFHYPGTERAVLSDVDLDLPAGATVAVVGENGSGKSTLVKLLLGMYRPDGGRILVDGTPLDELDPAAWSARTSAAFQDFARLQMPAVRSVGVADLPTLDDEDAASRALVRAGVPDVADALPDGLRTRVGTGYTGGQDLSGGQWQRLALGRAMRREEPLLVALDEPTASLDPQAEHALFDHYARSARESASRTGAVTVLVSHRFSTVLAADLIVCLHGGRVVEVGGHRELLARGGRYAELFALQAEGYRT